MIDDMLTQMRGPLGGAGECISTHIKLGNIYVFRWL